VLQGKFASQLRFKKPEIEEKPPERYLLAIPPFPQHKLLLPTASQKLLNDSRVFELIATKFVLFI